MKAIEVDGLVKIYGNVRAVDGVTFSVEEGELYALMGPNGSGKSTLASIIATVNPPTKGSVKVLAFDVISEAERVRTVINYVPEFSFSSTHLTGEENLILFARLFGMSKSRAKKITTVLLDKVGLSKASKDLVSKYSSGMRRRLEMASAFIGDASVLILDEPTTGLDPSIRRVIIGWLLEEVDGGRTILFTTHIGEDAEAASKVAFMKDGRIVAEGTPEGLKDAYVREAIVNVKTAAKGVKTAEIVKKFSTDGKVLETKDGYRLYSDKPEKVIPLIVEAVNKVGYKVLEIASDRPTLEDAFFKMTGVSLG